MDQRILEQQRPQPSHEVNVFDWINPGNNAIVSPESLRIPNPNPNSRYLVNRMDYNDIHGGSKEYTQISGFPVAYLRDMAETNEPLINADNHPPMGAITLGTEELLRISFGDRDHAQSILVGRNLRGEYVARHNGKLLQFQDGKVVVVGSNPIAPTSNNYQEAMDPRYLDPTGEETGLEPTHAMFWVTDIETEPGVFEKTLVMHDLSQTSGIYVDLIPEEIPKKPEKAETKTSLLAGGATDMGVGTPAKMIEHKKELANEDRYAIKTITWTDPIDKKTQRTAHLYIVADGMGGHQNGAIAAETAVRVFTEKLSAYLELPKEHRFDQVLILAANEANRVILEEAAAKEQTPGGATVAAALLDSNGNGACIGIGDARVYTRHGDELTQQTFDQTLVQELIQAGQLTENDRYTYERRNVLWNGLGVTKGNYREDQVSVRLIDLETEEDGLMLCCDGVWEAMSTPQLRREMARRLSTMQDPTQAAQAVIDLANGNGADDNLTVIAVKKAA